MSSLLDQAIREAIADENRRYIVESTVGNLLPVPEAHTCSKRRAINPTRADQCPVCTQPIMSPFTRRALEGKLPAKEIR